VGEYGQLLIQPAPQDESLKEGKETPTATQVVDLISKAMRLHYATEVTKSYCLNAFVKLTIRFADQPQLQPRLLKLVRSYQHSMRLELQQRSVEYLHLLKDEWSSLRPEVLAQMPVIDEEKLKAKLGRMQAKANRGLESSDEENSDDEGETDGGGGGGGGGGGADILGGGGGLAMPAAAAPAPAVQKDLLDLDDIFGGGTVY
jgi:AP-1 complex subunit gamma-1